VTPDRRRHCSPLGIKKALDESASSIDEDLEIAQCQSGGRATTRDEETRGSKPFRRIEPPISA
jgi:hypothetical protein